MDDSDETVQEVGISSFFLSAVSGTTIKDTGTKPRGRVEAGEGGGFVWGGVEGEGRKCRQL